MRRALPLIAIILLTTALTTTLYLLQPTSSNEVPVSANQTFKIWAKQHKRFYTSPKEASYRAKVFYKNLLEVQELRKIVEYKVGLTQFADLTIDEFLAKYAGHIPTPNPKSNPIYPPKGELDPNRLPKKVDWREKGIVNPIKNQGKCGSCYAFSAIQAIESAYAQVHKTLPSFSEQQMIDCSTSYGNYGCRGGWMDNVYFYIRDEKKIATSQSYPYTAYDDWCMDQEKEDTPIKLTKFYNVPHKDLKALAAAVAKQPVAAALNCIGFRNYVSGVYDDPFCAVELNHGIGIVGYGKDDETGKDYWIVRNSWGEQFGENGYIRMRKDTDNEYGICGITLQPSYPIIEA